MTGITTPFKKPAIAPESYVPLSTKQKEYVDLFNEQISNGTIKFETVPCLCGKSDFDLIAQYDRYSMLQDTVICKRCGLILSNPRMTDSEYKKFYETDIYRKCYESYDYLEGYEAKYNASTGMHILDIVAKVKGTGRIKKVMEFGAGGGWNLIAFKEKGMDVIGYDYSSSLPELGKKHGINMFRGTIGSVSGKFDLIILSHVIEHFTDLCGSMKKLKEHINPGGFFYIEVPDIKNFDMGQLQVAHTYHFTLPTLRFYLSKCGLKLIYHETAQGVHLGAIFEAGKEELGRDFLAGHYNQMRKLIKRYHMKKTVVCALKALGIKDSIKRFMQR